MIVRVLYFRECPNHALVVELAESVAGELGVDATLEEIEVRNQQEAEELRFLGSPTVQVDGADIEPAARSRTDFSFSCRMYGASGQPSRELMKAALLGDRTSTPNATFYASSGSIAAAVIASGCCWLPPLLLLFGVSTAGVSATFVAARPWFLGGAFVLLALGFYFSYLRKSVCEPGAACLAPNPKLVRFNRSGLWLAFVGVLAFAFFPKFFGLAAGDGTAVLPSEAPMVTLVIDGMSCESCASSIQQSLRSVAGVSGASVTYQDGRAIVALDESSPAKVNALVDVVAKVGFEARIVN